MSDKRIEVTEEMKARFAQGMKELAEEHTPLPRNKCKSEKCGGLVVKRVANYFRDRFGFHMPACNKCGRMYMNAVDAPEVGVKEFIDVMNRPFTI